MIQSRRTTIFAAATLCAVGATAVSHAAPVREDAPRAASAQTASMIQEQVFVQTETDTDHDGQPDRVVAFIRRHADAQDQPVAFQHSPYFGGVNDVPMHDVMVDYLPQDGSLGGKELDDYSPDMKPTSEFRERAAAPARPWKEFYDAGYAHVWGFSLGNGGATGCPTTGDEAEALGAKAIIDWLNGRAKGFTEDGAEVTADWASGDVGMYGVSYNGTLPNMVATTGVQGLKAIIPVAAISNWYDYYRANGLVVSPGGYLGEDADVLAKFVNQNPACQADLEKMATDQDRKTGDYTPFWQARNWVPKAKDVKAAVFVIHGQSDWNVRQKHAIQWWEALEEAGVPRRMWLHKDGHGYSDREDNNAQMVQWFDQYVKGEDAGADSRPAVQVQSPDGKWTSQDAWPSPATQEKTLRFAPSLLHEVGALVEGKGISGSEIFTDAGRDRTVEEVATQPTEHRSDRVAFLGEAFASDMLLSGTPRMDMTLAVENRHAANLTVALVDYDAEGNPTIVTRGWADPQNHASLSAGEQLTPGTAVKMSFTLEPKQYRFSKGHRMGVVIMGTDAEHTMRPLNGTTIRVGTGSASALTVNLGAAQ